MKDRVPKYPNRMKIIHADGTVEQVILERDDEAYEVGTPLNKQSLLSDETAYALELKTLEPTPNDAFLHIANNFTGDSGMNINLLEEMINMKFCKILEANKAQFDPWLAMGACKCVADSYTGNYRYTARIVANTSVLEIRKLDIQTGEIEEYTHDIKALLQYSTNSSYDTFWWGRIIPVVVRHSDHMIFMYNAGYKYNNTYKGVVGTVCIDTSSNNLVSIGSAAITSSSITSGYSYYNYTGIYAASGSMLANAVRTDSGNIRFWCGYNSERSGYIYSMAEGGDTFSYYSTYSYSNIDDYTNYACYVALYKNDYAHITSYSTQRRILFSATNTATLVDSYSLSGLTYYNQMSYISNSDEYSGGYSRSLSFSSDGNSSRFIFSYKVSPYQIYAWTNTTTSATPVAEQLDENSTGDSQYFTLSNFDDFRISAFGNTMLTDRASGKYMQSFSFEAKPSAFMYCHYETIAESVTTTPILHQMDISSGYLLNANNDGIIAWNKYGEIFDLKFYEEDELNIWQCPEDGIYKILLVGGGAAGGSDYGGGAGYLNIVTKQFAEGDEITYQVGKGGIYDNTIPFMAQITKLGDELANPATGIYGGADGASTTYGGGGGGYNLVIYGGQGQNANSYSKKDRNGGQAGTSTSSTSGDGYGAGGGYMQNGKDGVIVILR